MCSSMADRVDRREFLRRGATLASAFGAAAITGVPLWAQSEKIIRAGIIGVGGRGTGHVGDLLKLPGVQLKAVCDIVPSRVERVQNMTEKAGQPRPESYTRGEHDFERLCGRPDLDIVYVATPWEWHAPMCVAAMKGGKHAATEVPAATSIEECWQMVETSEATGKYCIQLENCCYDRVELMVLNMVRKGLLGEIVHAECGYLHDLRAEKLSDHNEGTWRLNHALKRNADLYPTHGLGPVAQTLNINRGNLFDHLVSMASKSYSLTEFAARKFGPDSTQAHLDVRLGDVVSSLIRTRAGQTVLVVHNTDSPRPYSRKVMLQGSKGVVEKYPTARIYVEGPGKEDWKDLLQDYAAEWEHPLWRELEQRAKGAGHGGMDYILNYRLMHCLQTGQPPDMDVYDAAALSAVTELSERSIAGGSRPVDFPDFTRNRWRSRTPLGVVTV
jgi:predicted dehydrogenase